MNDMNQETGTDLAADQLTASFDAFDKVEAHEAAIVSLNERVDTVSSEVDGVKARLDKVAVAVQRPQLSAAPEQKGLSRISASRSPAARAFVDGYLRTGRETEVKSFSAATPADGGYALPREIDAVIGRLLSDVSPIRQIATVVQTGSAGYRKLVSTGGIASGWVSETAGRPETGTPAFAEIAPPSGELFANPAASQNMLDDAAFDVEAWLADEIAREFGRAEGAAFINGSGVGQPSGFLTGPTSDEADDVRAFGTVQYLATGTAGDFDDADNLIDLVHALKPAYRQGASFVMNSATLAIIRKMKTADGQFLWQPAMTEGQPATLLGYPVVEAEDMPDVAADSLSIAFGNFREGYLIAERAETSILRDPYSQKPYVHFYATKRVSGQLMNSEAIKLMKFSVS